MLSLQAKQQHQLMPQQAPSNDLTLLRFLATVKRKYLVLVQVATPSVDWVQKMIKHLKTCVKRKINKPEHLHSKVLRARLLEPLKVDRKLMYLIKVWHEWTKE